MILAIIAVVLLMVAGYGVHAPIAGFGDLGDYGRVPTGIRAEVEHPETT